MSTSAVCAARRVINYAVGTVWGACFDSDEKEAVALLFKLYAEKAKGEAWCHENQKRAVLLRI